MPTVSEFREQFPEFSSTADADVERSLETARRIHSLRRTATLYCTAHILALEADDTDQPDGGSGEVVAEGAGPLRVSYSRQAEMGRETFFTRTSYGRMFLTLEKRTPSFAFSARVF